jgi:hypothetical protein
MNIVTTRQRLLLLRPGNFRDLSHGRMLRRNKDRNIRNVYAHMLRQETSACL